MQWCVIKNNRGSCTKKSKWKYNLFHTTSFIPCQSKWMWGTAMCLCHTFNSTLSLLKLQSISLKAASKNCLEKKIIISEIWSNTIYLQKSYQPDPTMLVPQWWVLYSSFEMNGIKVAKGINLPCLLSYTNTHPRARAHTHHQVYIYIHTYGPLPLRLSFFSKCNIFIP